MRRHLAKTPALLSAYLAWMNNRGRQRGLSLRGRGLAASLISTLVWVATVSTSMHVDAAAVTSAIAWLNRHDLLLAAVCAMSSAIFVARRRTLNRIAATRSWTAALPIEPSTARWQAIVLDAAPALFSMIILTVMFGSVCLMALVDADIQSPLEPWAAALGGTALGAALGHLLARVSPEEIYEGSRYVPHRRRAETPIPTGTLAALGSWPVRHLFASARPKTVARALIPILLAVPMGATAADVMVVIAFFMTIGVLGLLAAAAISVNAKAARWLKPLPLPSTDLARRTLIPVLAVMPCVAAIESWLLWVLGSSAVRCIRTGLVTLAVSATVAMVGSLLAVRAVHESHHGRP